MTKKAYLVTFEITTRVIADVHEGFDPNNRNFVNDNYRDCWNGIEDIAIDTILSEPQAYIGECSDISEDTECPYGTFEGED